MLKSELETMLFEPPIPENIQPAAKVIVPKARRWWITLDLLSALSHHDPAQGDKSNTSLFRRKKVFLDLAQSGRSISQAEIDKICQLNPIPVEIAGIFADISLCDYLATAILYRFIRSYTGANNGDGAGLFSGIERYRMLEERSSQQSVNSVTLFDFWSNICRELQVPAINDFDLQEMLHLLAVPSMTASIVLREIQERPRHLMMLAQAWRESYATAWKPFWESRKKDKQSAIKPSIETGEFIALHFNAEEHDQSSVKRISIQMPDVSANSIRHEIVREPAMLHLLNRLGIEWGELPPGVTALLYSGGGIEAGESAPMNAHQLREIACRKIPTLGLLGGSTNGFMLGESSLSVNAWIVCRENNPALSEVGLESNESIFDMIDRETLVRHPARVGQTPMPFNFETLIQGVRVAVCFTLNPYARDYEAGALGTAVETFCEADGTIAGQSARGFGRVDLKWHSPRPAEEMAAYEQYLQENRDNLREWLLNGTLGTDKMLCH